MEDQSVFSITGIVSLDNNPMFLMGFAYKQFRAQISHEMTERFGISLEMFGALKILDQHGQITQQELANFLLRNRSVMKRLVDNAIKLNLIQASKSDSNKKVKLLSLTAEGKIMVQQCTPVVDTMSEQFQNGLTHSQIEQLRISLATLIQTDLLVD